MSLNPRRKLLWSSIVVMVMLPACLAANQSIIEPAPAAPRCLPGLPGCGSTPALGGGSGMATNADLFVDAAGDVMAGALTLGLHPLRFGAAGTELELAADADGTLTWGGEPVCIHGDAACSGVARTQRPLVLDNGEIRLSDDGCQAGWVLSAKGADDEWVCQAPAAATSLRAGEGLQIVGDSYALRGCLTGDSLLQVGSAWQCAPVVALSVPCQPGELVTQLDVGWGCVSSRAAFLTGDGLRRDGNVVRLDTPRNNALGGVIAMECADGMFVDRIGSDGIPRCRAPTDQSAAVYTLPRFDLRSVIAEKGSSPDIAISPTGLPVVAYASPSGLAVAQCTDVFCASPPRTTIVDPSPSVGSVSLALHANGAPVLAYQDLADKDLKVAICQDPLCTSPQRQTVDSDGDVGGSATVLIPWDSYPIIAYHDATRNDAKVARCSSPLCDGPAQVSTVTSQSGDAGPATTMIFDVTGLPVVAFQDLSASYDASGNPTTRYFGFRVVRCGDLACATSLGGFAITSATRLGETLSMGINDDLVLFVAAEDATRGKLVVYECPHSAPPCRTDEADGGRDPSVAITPTGRVAVAHRGYGESLAWYREGGVKSTIKLSPFVDQTAMTLGADGHFVVATWSERMGSVSVTHIANEYGAMGWTRR